MFILPYDLLCKYISTYTNLLMMQNEFSLDYEKEKKKQTTILCMYHGPEVYDTAVIVTWVPCHYLQK